jgi:RNA polymerase sigma-70 factor (ECF subfamily)
MMPLVEGVSVQPDGPQVSDFHDFFEAQYQRLARALYLVTGERSEAEDMAQEAFVRVFERWGRVRTMDSPTGYLYRTALNLNRSRLRRFAGRARRIISVGNERGSDPAIVVESRDEIDRALDELPRAEREALVLMEWIGLSAEETAGVLGIRPVSARARLSRAKARIRRSLEVADD